MSKKSNIRLIPDPPRKSIQWYLNVDKPNPRLPYRLNPLDVTEDKCECNCDVLLEVSALDLHSFLIEITETVKQSQEASAIASLIRGKPVSIKAETKGVIVGKENTVDNLAFLQLCKQSCPKVDITAIWERTQTLVKDSMIGTGLREAVKRGITDREALGKLYDKLVIESKQFIKRFEPVKEKLEMELKHIQTQPRGKKAI